MNNAMKRSFVGVTVVLVAALALAGCGGYVSKTPTAYAQTENVHTFADLAAVAEKIRDGQPVEGAVYLRESYPDIAAVTEVATRWLKAVKDMDYRNYDKNAWLLDLTAERRNSAVAKGYVEGTAKDVANSKLITKHNDFNVSVVAFGPGYQSAILLGTESFTIIDAAQAWLKTNNVEKGKTYLNEVKLEMRKIDNVWQVDGYDIGAAVESK